MSLILINPHVASRSCEDCKKWLYDDRPDRMALKPVERAGERVPRIRGQLPQCKWCPKIPKGTDPIPENAVELSPRNWAVYQHYLQCKAVGAFPDDAIVRRNAMLIRQVEDAARRNESLAANVREILTAFVVGKHG